MSKTNLDKQKMFRKGSWSKEECEQFVIGEIQYYQALQKCGKEWPKMTSYVPTRSQIQIRSHGQKYFAKLEAQFQCKQILGQQFQQIKGDLNLRHYFICFIAYSVKPKTCLKSEIKTTSQIEPINPIKIQAQLDYKDPFSLVCEQTVVQVSSLAFTQQFRVCQHQSFFSQILTPDMSWNQVSQSNFYSLFVQKPVIQPLISPFQPASNIDHSNRGFISFAQPKDHPN